jgi:hypothetical protein
MSFLFDDDREDSLLSFLFAEMFRTFFLRFFSLSVFDTAESISMSQEISWIERKRILSLEDILRDNVFKMKLLNETNIKNLILFDKNFIIMIMNVMIDVWILCCESLFIRLFLILWSSNVMMMIADNNDDDNEDKLDER